MRRWRVARLSSYSAGWPSCSSLCWCSPACMPSSERWIFDGFGMEEVDRLLGRVASEGWTDVDIWAQSGAPLNLLRMPGDVVKSHVFRGATTLPPQLHGLSLIHI